MTYRLRVSDDGRLVLQVGEYKSGPYNYDNGLQWRDALVTDIPVYDLFKAPEADKRPAYYETTGTGMDGSSFGGVKLCGNGGVG